MKQLELLEKSQRRFKPERTVTSNSSVKATTLFLIRKWPDFLPITKSILIRVLFLVDKEGGDCLGIDWEIKRNFPRHQELEESLDNLGCLRTIKNRLNSKIKLEEHMKKKQLESATRLIKELTECGSLGKTYTILARADKIIRT